MWLRTGEGELGELEKEEENLEKVNIQSTKVAIFVAQEHLTSDSEPQNFFLCFQWKEKKTFAIK